MTNWTERKKTWICDSQSGTIVYKMALHLLLRLNYFCLELVRVGKAHFSSRWGFYMVKGMMKRPC